MVYSRLSLIHFGYLLLSKLFSDVSVQSILLILKFLQALNQELFFGLLVDSSGLKKLTLFDIRQGKVSDVHTIKSIFQNAVCFALRKDHQETLKRLQEILCLLRLLHQLHSKWCKARALDQLDQSSKLYQFLGIKLVCQPQNQIVCQFVLLTHQAEVQGGDWVDTPRLIQLHEQFLLVFSMVSLGLAPKLLSELPVNWH